MRRITRAALGLALLSSYAAGQTAAPQPPADEDLRLRIDVNLVQVDAVVTDRKGNHVAGLTAEDFEVLQDGVVQTIKHLIYMPPQRPSPAVPEPAAGSQLARAQVQRTMILMLDDWNMEFADFVFAQRAMIRYVDRELRPGDLVGVVRTSGGSGAMQQLSADPEFLRTVLRRMVWHPLPPYVNSPLFPVLKQVVWGLREFPGRKSVILISPGTPTALGNTMNLDLEHWQQLQRLADLAVRCSVTIHSIDVRGLPTVALPEASEPSPVDGSYSLSGPGWSSALLRKHAEYFGSQGLLMSLADMTGGLFLRDSNDLFRQVRDAAEDAEGYYLIGWYPGAEAFANKPNAPLGYHNLRIQVKPKGLTVRSRRGYYAVAGTDLAPLEHFSPQTQMREALFSPFQSAEIAVRLTPSFGYDPGQGAYVKSLLHIRPEGIEFHPEGSGCDSIRLEVLTSVLPLSWSAPEDSQVHWWRGALQACGKARERALREGLVVVARTPVERPGSIQLRAAVRNLESGQDAAPAVTASLVRRDGPTPVHIPVGSATAVLEIPDLSRAKFALSGVSLRGSTAPSGQATNVAARLLADGDPATRQFHPGDPLIYEFELFGRAAGVETRIQVMREGKAVWDSEPLGAEPGTSFAGTYRLEASAEPGKYLLGVVARDSKGKGRTVTQWIDFEVAP